MSTYRDAYGNPVTSHIEVVLPPHVWDEVHRQRQLQQGMPNARTMHLSAWFQRLILDHHLDPIAWPSSQWLIECGEGKPAKGHWRAPLAAVLGPPMVRRMVSLGPKCRALLDQRAAIEGREGRPGVTPTEILRRLVRQVLGV